jgi:hypothetical protein
LSLTLFEKTQLFRLFHDLSLPNPIPQPSNQLNLFD